MSLSKIQIIGNLGRDPELRYTPNGRPVASFTVAVNQSTKNQQTNEWIESTDWFGKMSSRYATSALDESAWSRNPRIDSARKMIGTNEASAKYATIAARCVPRSPKNRSNVAPTARMGAVC